MIITREKGMRMWGGGSGSTSASGVNGGGGFSLAVEEGEGTGNAYTDFTYESGTLTLNKATEFVTVDFFNKLFTAYDANGNVIAPNNTTPTLGNIKFMAGAWTEQYLSALGQNSSGGGGGGGIELSDVWQSLKTNTDDYANQKINAAHIPDLSGTYATKTWVNQQGFVTSSGVTSVAMTVPTGLSVSGTPITSTGTLALTFATGYSIPTTTKQSNWDTAYGWGNHATAGYAMAATNIIAGNGLTGGGTLAADRTLSIQLQSNSGLTVSSSGLKLDIINNLTTESAYKAISATQAKKIWDLLNQMFTLEGAGTTASPYVIKANYGLYTEQFLSALGQNSSGGGGGDFDEEQMWAALQSTSGTYGNEKIATSHIPDMASTYGYLKSSALNGYATQSWVNQQGFLTTHQTLYTLSIYGGTTKVLDFKPNTNASIYIKAGGDISLTNDTTNKYITLSYTHPTNGANTTISAASGKVLSAITVNSLGHVTSVSSKTLASADIPDLSSTYATAARATTLEGYFTNGVAKTAAKLNTGTTTYTAWGQTYWSSGVPQSISGNMTSVGSITPSANGNALGTTSARFNIYGTSGNFSGNVSITGTLGVTGATTLSSTLSVASGITLTTTKKIYFGDTSHYLELNSTGFHFSHGVYSDSFVSALGANSSGGGSGTFDEEAMWVALGTTISAKVIASSHIPNLAASKITSGTFAAARIPIATASAVGGIKVGTTLAISDGVLNQKSGIATAGTYRSVTVDTYGRVTSGTNPTTLSGYGITNAYTKTQVDTALSGYLPLSGGTLAGTLTAPKIRINTRHSSGDTRGGIYYYDGTTDYLLIGQGSANLWIGANETVGTHHTGGTYISAGSDNAYICRLVNNTRSSYLILDSGNYSSYALPLSGGEMTGPLTWKNATALSGVTSTNYVLCIDGFADGGTTHYITTANLSVGSATKATQDGDGNTISSTYLKLSGGTITGNLAVRGYIYLRDNNKGLYTTDTADNVQNTLYLNDANELLIGHGTAGSGYNTHIYGNNLYLRYGTSRTIGITLSSSGSTTFAGAITAKENAHNYTTDATSYGLNMNNSDMIGVNGIFTSDTADNWAEGINFKRTDGKWDSLRAKDNFFYFGNKSGTESVTIMSQGTNAANGVRIYGSTYSISFEIGSGNTNRGIYDYTSSVAKWLIYFDASNTRLNFGNVIASGDVTASSDERKKHILGETIFSVKDIASARSILYKWNDNRDKGIIHGGSIAQDWLGKADDFITKDDDGYMSLNYGALALCSAITIAREVVKHEDRITLLEKENARLKARVEELEERRVA